MSGGLGGMDLSQFFSPQAWGGWNPPPQSMFPMANTNGMAPTPSGLLGNPFGLRPPNPAPNALNMPRPPTMGNMGPLPNPPAMGGTDPSTLTGGAPISGNADPMSGGGTAGVPGAGMSPNIGDILKSLGKTMSTPSFMSGAQGLSKLMSGGNGIKSPVPLSITMPTPVGPGNMSGMGGGIAGLLSPLLQSGRMPGSPFPSGVPDMSGGIRGYGMMPGMFGA